MIFFVSPGLLVAENEEVARKASKLVKISYTNIQEPVLTLQEAIKHPEKIEPTGDPIVEGDVEKELKGSAKTVSGEFGIGSQYPFHLETQICISVPKYYFLLLLISIHIYTLLVCLFVCNCYT